MVAHAVDAALSGDASQTGDILAVYALDSTQAGDATQTGDLLASWALDSTQAGEATQTGILGFLLPLDSALSGDASQAADLLALFALVSTQTGGADQIGDIGLSMPLDSALSGDASQTNTLLALYALTSTQFGFTTMTGDVWLSMSLDSSLDGGAGASLGADLFLLIGVTAGLSGDADYSGTLLAFLSATLVATGSGFQVGVLADLISMNFEAGGTFMDANITWKPHPGAPPPTPSINAAILLQQFIDSTGSNRKRVKTSPANNPMVDPNPPPKPFKPK